MANPARFSPRSARAARKLKLGKLAPLAALILLLSSPALAQRSPAPPSSTQGPLPNQPFVQQKVQQANTQAPRTPAQAAKALSPAGKDGFRPAAQRDWLLPVQGKITNPFGNSYHYYQIYRGGHTGVDIAAPKGTPVRAVAAGKVVKVWQTPNQRYGQYVVIQHGPQLFSLYGHLASIRVKPGQTLAQGQPLGGVGVTGAAGYPHLHIEALDSLPRNDGAWGYLYICRSEREQVSFVNEPAFVISAIQRQQGADCKPRPLVQTLTYYNPEVLWSPKAPVMRQVAQPENEERRWRGTRTARIETPSSALARPEQSPRLLPAVQLPSRAASPDKSAAPSESGAF